MNNLRIEEAQFRTRVWNTTDSGGFEVAKKISNRAGNHGQFKIVCDTVSEHDGAKVTSVLATAGSRKAAEKKLAEILAAK